MIPNQKLRNWKSLRAEYNELKEWAEGLDEDFKKAKMMQFEESNIKKRMKMMM